MKKEKIKVSIITVSYNAVDTIEQTIQSVLNQSYKNIEYIIVDGQSTDGTIDIVNRYKQSIDYFVSESDRGLYDAMNKGIQKATGDILGIINSDDWYETNAIEKIVNCFEKTKAELVYGKVCNVDENGEKRYGNNKPLDNIWYTMVTPHPSVFILTRIYKKYGSFDISYKIAADDEMILRFFVAGVKFQYLDEVIANYRLGGISTTKAEECAEEKKIIRLSYLEKFSGDKEELKKKINKQYNIERFVFVIKRNPDLLRDFLKQKFMEFNNEIIIFGTGIWGKNCYSLLEQCNINIIAYVDNNRDKWGVKIKGTVVENPEILRSGKGYVLVAVRYVDTEIVNQLKNYNNNCLHWITIEEIISGILQL